MFTSPENVYRVADDRGKAGRGMTSGRWAWGVCLGLAIAVRLLSGPSVLPGDEGWRWAGGPDSWYHARRALLASEGHAFAMDAWINYPFGESVHWPPAWTRTLGIAFRLGGPFAAALLPVVVGTLTSLLLFAAFRAPVSGSDMAGPGQSPAASSRERVRRPLAASFAILPALVYPSVLGALDHHAIELLWYALAIWGLSRDDPRGTAAAIAAVLLALVSVPAWPVVATLTASGLAFRYAEAGGRPRLGVLALAVAALSLPAAGWSYFSDPWIRGIDEARPLLASPLDLARAVVMLGPGFCLLPFALPRWWRERKRADASLFLVATAIGLPLALLQIRFIPYLAFASMGALVLFAGAAILDRRLRALLLLASMLPPARGLVEIASWPPDPPPALSRALAWVREHTPSPGDPTDAGRLPAWGVVSAWDLGNHVLGVAGRAAVADAFHTGGQGRTVAARVLGDEPLSATREADAVPAPVLVLTNLGWGYARSQRLAGQPAPIDSLYGRLYFRSDRDLGWRLGYASPETFLFEGAKVPEVQVWIREGAWASDTASPLASRGIMP